MAVVADCQANGVLEQGDARLATVSIWSCIHGFVQLLLGNQLPGALVAQYSVPELFKFHLHQFLRTGKLNPSS
jgi:hypothetical protein